MSHVAGDLAGLWAKWWVILVKGWPPMRLMVTVLCSSLPLLSLPSDLGWLMNIFFFSRSLFLDLCVNWHDFIHSFRLWASKQNMTGKGPVLTELTFQCGKTVNTCANKWQERDLWMRIFRMRSPTRAVRQDGAVEVDRGLGFFSVTWLRKPS